MCRNVEHGGRRCPNDNNTARRLRRTNATLKASYAGSTHEPMHSDKPNNENQTPQTLTTSVEDVRSHMAQMEYWKNHLWNAEGNVARLTEEDWIIDGVKYDNPFEFRAAMLSKVEQDTIRLGGLVAAAAAARTGFRDEDIIKLNENNLSEAEADFNKARDAYQKFFKQLKETYNIPEMDAPFHLKGRIEMWEQNNPNNYDLKQVAADAEEGIRLYEYYKIANNAFRDARLTGSLKAAEMFKANQQAQKEILGEVRALGGTQIVNEKSNAQKVKVLQQALEVYPTEWIEESNKTGDNLIIKKTVARAHYSDNSFQQEYKVTKMGYIKSLDREPNNTHHESGWVKLETDEYGEAKYVDEQGIEHTTYVEEGKTAYYAPTFEYYSPYYHASKDGKPKGRGWEQATVVDMKYDAATQTRTPEEVTTWRRVKTRRQLVSLSTKAELLIDGDGGNGLDTALHEYMHRAEAKVSRIGDVEAEFIRRRTTLATGEQEKFVTLYKGKTEISRVDNFVDDYMGKHYGDSKHWEVLSTGAEAVFGKSFGNLMGFGQRKVDLEHRDFVLGVFAGI